jgi:soluble lytic murein transglycosylase-like protein
VIAAKLNRTKLVLALSVAVASNAARADLWGYIDESGRAHFAAERLDERYRLFFKGQSTLDAKPTPTQPAQSLERLRSTPLYQRVVASPNVKRFEPLIESHANKQRLDPALVKAVIAVESAFDPEAISSKGAVGLMQVMPETGERYGVVADARRSAVQRLMDPATNVGVGTRYLRDLLALFANDLALALAAYNAGERAVLRYARVPPFPDTQAYVERVQQFYQLYRPSPPPAAPPATPSRIAIPRTVAPRQR